MGTQRISLINKQYLPEIEVTRKKKSYTQLLETKKDDGKKVKLARDTLFIDGEVFTKMLMNPRVESPTYSQKNGDRLPKKTPLAPDIFSKP